MSGVLQHAVAFGLALLGTLAATPVAVAAGSRLGVLVQPRLFGGGDRWVSPLGGAVLAVVACAVVPLAGNGSSSIWSLLAGGVALVALGVLDDHRREGLTARSRLGIESLVAAAVWWAGLRPDLSTVPVIDLVLTVFFLVGAANAFNLLDNMDGVAGATAVASAAGIVVLASLYGDPLVAGLAATVGGAALGFLHHNLGGGSVFLGNGGALFLGFVLGGAALMLHVPLPGRWGIPAAVVLMAVPAADTTLVIVARTLARRPVTQGGTDHASHRLVAAGLSPVGAAAGHAGGAAVAAVAVGVAAAHGRPEILLVVLVAFAGAGFGLLRVPVMKGAPPARSTGPAPTVRPLLGAEVLASEAPPGSVGFAPSSKLRF